jgi:hypothetical protein
VTIATEPAGAACLLTGGAEPVGAVPAAPAVVRLEQAPRDVRVFCTLAGHAPVVAVLPVGPDRGELVSGGGGRRGGGPDVRCAGAGRHAPLPVQARRRAAARAVRHADERDRFSANRMDESRLHFDQPIRALKSMCRADEFGCQHTIAEMGRARDEELARLEELRKATPAPQ